MKKVLFGLVAVVIAISSVAIVKANPNIDALDCPNGSSIYYYVGPNASAPSTAQLQNQANWSTVAPDVQTECGDIVKICAICAFPDEAQALQPEFNLSQLSGVERTHTSDLLSNLNIYAGSDSPTQDDSVDGFIFEKQ